jgi:hypothetical protein
VGERHFVQDDWRLSRRLTLNLGVRYDVLTAPTEVAGRQSNFDLQTGAIRLASGNRDPLVDNNYHNISPRAGFAYDITGKERRWCGAVSECFTSWTAVESTTNSRRMRLSAASASTTIPHHAIGTGAAGKF